MGQARPATNIEQMVSSLRRPAYGPWLLLVLVTGLAGYGAYWGWGERQRLMGEADKGQDAVRAHKQLEDKYKELEAEKAALVAAKDSLQKIVEAKSSELAELKGTHDKLQDKMKDEIAKGEIELTQSGLRLKVDMVDKILFDSGDAAISKRGEGVLARVGGVLANIADKQIHVSGHTDNQPITGKLLERYPSNWELSMARAMTIVRFLQDTAKVPPESPGRHRPGRTPPHRQQQDRQGPRPQPPDRDPADPGPGGTAAVEAGAGRADQARGGRATCRGRGG